MSQRARAARTLARELAETTKNSRVGSRARARWCHDTASLRTPESSRRVVRDEDRFWFDTNGFLILRNVFDDWEIEVGDFLFVRGATRGGGGARAVDSMHLHHGSSDESMTRGVVTLD